MGNLKNPCTKCPKEGTKKCDYRQCGRWLRYYNHRQSLINAYALKVLPAYYASLEKGGDGGGSK